MVKRLVLRILENVAGGLDLPVDGRDGEQVIGVKLRADVVPEMSEMRRAEQCVAPAAIGSRRRGVKAPGPEAASNAAVPLVERQPGRAVPGR